MVDLIQPAPHEFDAYLHFAYNPDDREDPRLRPFWAFEHVIREHGGATDGSAELDGDTFEFSLSYSESGIETTNHPSEDVDTIREYWINWELATDPAGQCSGSFHVAPRTQDLETADGSPPISVPPGFVGVAVRAQGSNLPFGQYTDLFREICKSRGISRRYWRDEWIHETSNIRDAEMYVRIEREHSGPFVAVDGPISRTADLLAGDREGYRKHVADDTKIEGYYHTATIGAGRAAELIDLHKLPKEIKHYYGKHPQHTSDDHPTHYPKIGVSYQASLHDDTLHLENLNRLERELDETLLNLLRWGDLPVQADHIDGLPDDRDEHEHIHGRLDDAPGPFVDDAYWRVQASHRQRRLVECPLPEIEADQQSVVIRALRDGLEESDRDVLETLVTDGSQVAPADVADEHDWHLETVYTALDRLGEIVDHQYGELQLQSHNVARRVLEAVERADEEAKNALEVSAKALAGSDRPERASDAMTEWLDQHGVEIEDRDDGRLHLRTGDWPSTDDLRDELQAFAGIWMRAGFDRDRLLSAAIHFRADGYSQHGMVSGILD